MPRTWQQNTQRFIPWPEEVTVTSVRPNSSNVGAVLPDAAVYKLSGLEGAASYGVYVKYMVRVTLGYDSLEFTPKPRDTILWKGDTYTILSATGSDWTKHWVLDAVNLVLAADLRQTCRILRPPELKDGGGRPALSTYATLYDAVPCRLQPLESARGEALGRATSPRRYIAYVAVQVWPLRARDVLVVDGIEYTIDTLGESEKIDELPAIQCTLLD